MSILDGIEILVEDAGQPPAFPENFLPLLHQIRHALSHLLQTGEATILDLGAIPFGPADEEKLLSFLGVGEIESRIDALGQSRVRESRYPGVWLVEHKNPGEERISLQIEIAEVPEILKAQKADIRDGLENLSEKLSTEGL